MRALTLDAVRQLAGERKPPCLSLYMPTHRTHMGGQEDRIRFRNLVSKAEKLLASSYGNGVAKELTAPLGELDRPDFWNHQLDGLAVFAAEGLLEEYRLPMVMPELSVAADSFHLLPLMRFLQSNQGYFLLALSQNRVAVHSGGASGLEPIEVEGLPKSMVDALGPERAESFLNVRGDLEAPEGGGMYHGHGSDKLPGSEDVLRYLRAVDKAVWPVLRGGSQPLVLAAPIEYHAPYRSVSRYKHLTDEGITGNFDRARPQELHEKAWELVSTLSGERLGELLTLYGNAAPHGRATAVLERIGPLAVQGRVSELLIAEGARVWGRLDPGSGEVTRHERQQDAHDDDVLDDIAEAVLLRGGEVWGVDKKRMPDGAPVAAILRW